jgi:hypothetical protein
VNSQALAEGEGGESNGKDVGAEKEVQKKVPASKRAGTKAAGKNIGRVARPAEI